MKLKKDSLIYDISNMAYVIADTGDDTDHTLHRVRDICQDGNIDRVSRILGLAYAEILTVLAPVLKAPEIDPARDNSSSPKDYVINFSDRSSLRFLLTPEWKLKIKETCHEYMVSMVLADWLAVDNISCGSRHMEI